jgi:hypothetical protein
MIDVENRLSAVNQMENFNNQLQLLKDKFVDSNILFYQGHQFTIQGNLLSLCKSYIDLHRTKDVVLLDDYQTPVLISDLTEFSDNAWHTYQTNLNQYHTEYQTLIKNKGHI